MSDIAVRPHREPPSFLGAWRGIWLFTWRSRFAWRHLPVGLLKLLALPALIYLTTSSTRSWSRHHPWAGDPRSEISGFARRLGRAGLPLQPEQQEQLLAILTEEYAQANTDEQEQPGTEAGSDHRGALIQATYKRIADRARTVLDDAQFDRFQTMQKARMQQSLLRPSGPSWGRTGAFYHWLVDVYFFVVLPLGCVAACGTLIREELQADTLGFLTTRPVSRGRLVLAKYLSTCAWLQLVVVVEAALVFASGALREMPALGTLLPRFLLVQAIAVMAWSALGAFFGLVTRRYMALALVYGVIVELGIGRIPTNINTLSLMRHLKTLLAHDASLQGVFDWSAQGTTLSLAALAVGTVLFLTLAAVMFTFVEYHHTTEMQK
jgi:hypothetical protein